MPITDTNGAESAISVHYPNDNLVSTIIRAWLDEGFKHNLLTFPEVKSQSNWDAVSKGDPTYTSAQSMLAEMGVYVDYPIVLTPDQYKWGYQKKNDCEVIYVLPEEPGQPTARYSVDTARTAMKFCPFGM